MYYFNGKSQNKYITLRHIKIKEEQTQTYTHVKLLNVLKKREKAYSFTDEVDDQFNILIKPMVKKPRRKSCHCNQCGAISKFQYQCQFDCPIRRKKVNNTQRLEIPMMDRKGSLAIETRKQFMFMNKSLRRVTNTNWKIDESKSPILEISNQRNSSRSFRNLELISQQSSRNPQSPLSRYAQESFNTNGQVQQLSPTNQNKTQFSQENKQMKFQLQQQPSFKISLTSRVKTETVSMPCLKLKKITTQISPTKKKSRLQQLNEIFILPYQKKNRENSMKISRVMKQSKSKKIFI